MDSEKLYDYCQSETSSEEADHHHHQPEKSSDENSGGGSGGRFYECTYCKRGFTNAQALGGHMNIHRKEKAKTKPKTKKGSVISSKSSQEDEYRYNYSSNQASYYTIPFEAHQQMNYQFYYPSASPNCPIAYHQMISGYGADDHDHQGHDRHLGYYEDHRIDGRHNEVAAGSMVWEENEIDLELHL